MWFPNPVALACLTCGQPTVVAETSSGSVRVHCGTWRWQCDTLATGTPEDQQYRPTPVSLLARDAATDQELAA